MGNGILVDWHVATQLGLPAKDMQSFLSGIEAIRRPFSSESIDAAYAINGLAQLERWAQIYILIDVCRELRKRGLTEPITKEIQRTVVLPILKSAKGNLHRKISSALGSFTQGDPTQQVMADLSKAVSEFLEQDAKINLTQPKATDYLDLEEQDLPALLLSMLIILAEESSETVSDTISKDETNALKELCMRALAGHFGRWCLLVSVDLGVIVPDLTAETDLRAGLQFAVRRVLTLEPDLIWREIKLTFSLSSSPSSEDRSMILESLFEELVTLRHWRSLSGPLFGETGQIKDLSKKQRGEIRKSLVFWQEAIWHAMAGIDPLETAMRLGKLWIPRILNIKSTAKIELPISKKELFPTITLYWELGNQYDRQPHRTELASGNLHEDADFWISHSPWPKVSASPPVRTSKGADIIACAAAASFEARLAQKLTRSQVKPSDWRNFAAHILYFLQEFRRYRYVNESTDRIPDVEARNVFVLVHSCRASAQRVASGRMHQPTPDEFIKLLESATESGWVEAPMLSNAEVDLGLEAIINRKVLASCVRLVEHVMSDVSDGGRRRWVALISRLSDHSSAESLDEDEALLLKLFVRFLADDHSVQVEDQSGLQRVAESVLKSLDEERPFIGARHRSLLLVPTEDSKLWQQYDDVVQRVPNFEGNGALLLTWACQRFVASSIDTLTPLPLKDQWREALKDCLDRVSDESSLDRFLRLRFIELLRSGLIATEKVITKKILGRLVEFGTAHDLARLIDWIVKEPLEAEYQLDIRRMLIHGIASFRARLSNLEFETTTARADAVGFSDSTERMELVDRLVAACLVPDLRGEIQASLGLLEWARNDRDQLVQRLSQNSKLIEPFFTDRWGQPRTRSGSWFRQNRALAFAVDPNTKLFNVLDPLEFTFARDLFSARAVEPDSKQYFLGILEDFLETDFAVIRLDNDDAHCVQVRRSSLPADASVGRLLAVRCASPSSDGLWRVLEIYDLHEFQLSRLFVPTRVEFTDQTVGLLPVHIDGVRSEKDWKFKTDNYLALHGTERLEEDYRILVSEVVEANGRHGRSRRIHSPIEGDFIDLLLHYPQLSSGVSSLTLCLRSMNFSDEGTLHSLVVEALPLQVFSLRFSRDFTISACVELENTLQTLSDAGSDISGLLVTVRIVRSAIGPQLDLEEETSSLYPVPNYGQKLSKPIDERNIHWRELFHSNAEEIDNESAARTLLVGRTISRNGKVVEVAIPDELKIAGFPESVTVEAATHSGGAPDGAERIVDVWLENDTWDPHTVRAEGIYAEANELKLSRGRDEDVRKIMDLQQGSTVKLMNFGRRIDIHGFVLAFTPENLRIRVQAESLSMLPIDPNRVHEIPGVRGRLAQLRGNNIWKRQKTIPDIPLDELPTWVRERKHTVGLLTRIPTPSVNDQGAELSCEVAWEKGSEIAWGRLLVKNLSAFRYPLWQGTKVIIKVSDEITEIWFETPDLVAEALWERETEINDQYNLDEKFIGSARLKNELHDFFELRGGSVYSTKSTNSHDFRPDLQNQVLTDVSNANWWGPNWRGEPTQRCVLKFGDTDARLCGLRANGDRPGRSHFLGSDLLVSSFAANDEGAKLLTIRRRFKLRSVQQRARPERAPTTQSGAEQNINERRVQKVSEWLSMETTLDGRFHQDRQAFQVRDQSLNKLFSEGIAVTAEAAKLRKSQSPYRNKSARAVVVSDDPVTASCVATRPLSLEDLMDALEAEVGAIVKIDPEILELYLVGISSSDLSGETIPAEYIFEWGYGFWVSVSASRLRFKGQDIKLSDLQLFVEDQISAVRFEMHQGELTMSVEDAIPCQAHVLFNQADQHQIIHPLHVRLSRAGDVRVIFVEGFDPTTQGDPRRPMGRSGSISGLIPQLDDAGVEVVLSRAQNSKSSATRRWQGVVMARLDTDTFRRSNGEELRFQYVRLDQEFTPEAQGIRDGDRIFARLGRIFPLPNDFAVEIKPYSGLHHSDIHPDFADPIVLRRPFSFRQQTLIRLYRESPDRLVDHYVLVKVGLGKRIFLSIRDGAPFRQSTVLESLLSTNEKNVFAIYAGTIGRDQRSVQLEMRPGVVVSLRSTEVVISDELIRGDVVRVLRSVNTLQKKYLIERALYSDMRYARERRPIVALPMQNLAKPDSRPPYKDASARATAANSFSVGSLPDVSGNLRRLTTEGEVFLPSEKQIEHFMMADHPKIAWLEGNQGQTGDTPESKILIDFARDIAAARLEFSDPTVCSSSQNTGASEIDDAHLKVRILPLPNGNPSTRNLRTDWYMLTFRDASARRLVAKFHEAGWRYHDQDTIVWSKSKSSSPERKVIEKASLRTGPLFIEERAGSAILRYSINDVKKHAIGFGNLFDGWNTGETIECVVAGSPSEGGLYVEVVPGRIVELPPSMLVWRDGQNEKIILDDLDWGVFSPGDELMLQRLKESDSFSPERVLITWKHSIRNAFGPVGAALINTGQNLKCGSAEFGVAGFQISLPSTTPQKLPELALIGGLDILKEVRSNDAPPKSSTVILSKQENGQITINGFESWRALPDKDWDWEKDSLMNSVMTRRSDGSVLTDWTRMDQRVQLSGGSIPVTVELGFKPESSRSGVIYFSRRHQELSIVEGKFALISVLGNIPGTNWIVVKCGGRQTALPAFQLVKGLPEGLLDRVIEQLRLTETPVWIHKFGSKHQFGIPSLEKSLFLVSPKLVVTTNDGKVRGFVCAGLHDRRLHWLPVERASAAPLTEETASATFLGNGRYLEVMTRPDDSVSFVDHPRVQRELSSMELGRKFGVEIVCDDNSSNRIWDELDFDRDQLKMRLVRSRSTGLVLSAAVSGKSKGHVLEVAERKIDRQATYVFLLPSTKRRLRYCFPKNLAEVVHLHSGKPQKEEIHLSAIGHSPTLDKFNFTTVYKGLGETDEVPYTRKELIEFCKAYIQSEHVSLLAGISGAVVLDRCGEVEDSVLLELLRNIGYRCMQSFHMEILCQWFADRQVARSKESLGTRARIDDVFSLVLKSDGSAQGIRAKIDRIYDHLALNGSTAYERALADAVAVGFGQVDKLDDLISHHGYLEHLTDALQAVRSLIMLSKPSEKALRRSVSALDVIGKRLINMETDVILNRAITFERRRSR